MTESSNNRASMMLRRMKQEVAALVNRHPYFWYVAWRALPHLKFLLPHEKSYYAFRHLASREDGLFLDVGANQGLSALGFRRLVPRYRILSIEPNQVHEPSLRRLRRRMPDFDYIIAAAGHENSEFTLYTATYRGMALHTGSSLNLEYLKTALGLAFSDSVVRKVSYITQTVKVIRLDDLGLRPAIIKTDAEGFDYQVLVGLRETIAGCRPPVLVEYSPGLSEKLAAFCADLSYALFVYDHVRDWFLPFVVEREARNHISGGSPVNLFLIPLETVNALPLAPRVTTATSVPGTPVLRGAN